MPNFRSISRLSILLAVVAASPAFAAPKPGDARPAGAGFIAERGGLPNTFRRLLAGEKTVVAFLGGSITHGSGASVPENCYREKFTRYLKEQFPKADVTGVHAAVGGTGSWLGAFRLKDDALDKGADLVLVEFAVNDGDDAEPRVLASMEGIVRQVRAARPEAEVLFVYTLAAQHLDAYRANRLPERVQWHEKVAAAYNIPSVNMAQYAAAQIIAGKLTLEQFTPDGAHPTDRGYALYEEALEQFMAKGRAAAEKKPAAKAATYRLPKPMTPCPLERGLLVPVDRAKADANWKAGAPSACWKFGTVLASDVPGATVTLTFKGDCAGIYQDLGPDTGDFDVSVDGKPWAPVKNFDDFAKTMYRIHGRTLAEGLDPKRPHEVKLRVAAATPSGSKGRMIRFGWFLVDGEKP